LPSKYKNGLSIKWTIYFFNIPYPLKSSSINRFFLN